MIFRHVYEDKIVSTVASNMVLAPVLARDVPWSEAAVQYPETCAKT